MKRFLILAFAALLLTDCNYKPSSVGKARDILVFTVEKDLIQQELSFALQQQILTPQPGKEFNVRYMQPEDLETHTTYHGILFVGFEQDSLIRTLFPKLSANDSFALYRVNDPWAKNQSVLVFVARDTLSMLWGLHEVRDKIHETFKYRLLERLSAMTYTDGEDEKLSKKVEDYGFKLKIPRDWLLDERYAEERFIWVHAHEPDRSIFVYWEDKERSDITPSAMFNLHDSLTARFYQGDYLDTTFTTAGPSYFRGQDAVRIEGVWQNDSLIVGGPMISYSFNEGGRFYMIDAMLFYPETPQKKIFWLNQLEVILATFKPVSAGEAQK